MIFQKEAAARVEAEMAKRLPEYDGDLGDDVFDPWSLFPCLYGIYNSEFDELAIDVLAGLRDKRFARDDLAGEMFREMLCTAELCDYGTSPRVCFTTPDFKELLPRLIEMWKSYRNVMWGP